MSGDSRVSKRSWVPLGVAVVSWVERRTLSGISYSSHYTEYDRVVHTGVSVKNTTRLNGKEVRGPFTLYVYLVVRLDFVCSRGLDKILPSSLASGTHQVVRGERDPVPPVHPGSVSVRPYRGTEVDVHRVLGVRTSTVTGLSDVLLNAASTSYPGRES